MADNSESFASVEQITSRPNYSKNLEITVESFLSLVGRYHLSESVRCQVKTEHGICGQKHQLGYVGLTKEGHEGLIGGICGEKYFKEHTLFVQEKNRIDAEIDRRENIEKLNAYKENFFSLNSSYADLRKEIEDIKRIAEHLYNGFPDIVLSYIYQAQRTKNWDLYVDVLRHERSEKGMTSNWHVEKLCTFTPLPSLQEIKSLQGRIENIVSLFNEVCSSKIEDISTPKLKGYVRSISEFSEIEIINKKFHKDIKEFTKKSSLHNLYYICANTKDKLSTVKTIVTLNSKSIPTENTLRTKCLDIETATNKKFDNCTVRYNKIIVKMKRSSIG